MKINFKTLIISLAIPLFVGILASLLTGNGMDTFMTVTKPPLTPPGWLFPVVWTILYMLMGFASYLVLTSSGDTDKKSDAIKLYILQLIVNFFWPIIFFNKNAFWLSFFIILLLRILIALTIIAFNKVSKKAALLMLPYFIWVTFATYLTLGISLLN